MGENLPKHFPGIHVNLPLSVGVQRLMLQLQPRSQGFSSNYALDNTLGAKTVPSPLVSRFDEVV